MEVGCATHDQAEEALRLCEELTLNLLYQDFSLYGGMQLHNSDRQITAQEVKAICDHVKPYKKTIGYYIWDEPYVEDQLYEARRQMDMFQYEDPARLPFTVAIPSYNDKYTWENGEFAAYLERYCTIIDPPMLSLDYYPIGLRWYTDEKQLDDSFMWLDLGQMRKMCRKYHMPLWFYYHGKNYTNYSRFTPEMVRMNMYAGVLYGAVGLQQYKVIGETLNEDGSKGKFFDTQKQVHQEFKMLGNTLMALKNVNVIHSDDLLPGCEYMEGLAETMADSRLLKGTLQTRTSVGEFEDDYGNQYLLVFNRDYEKEADVMLELKECSRLYEVSRVNGRQSVVCDSTEQINVHLAKGDAILYRVQAAAEEAFTIEYRIEK